MTQTSVLEIQVNDAQFLAFAEKLEKFRKNATGGAAGRGQTESSFGERFQKTIKDSVAPLKSLRDTTHDIYTNVQKTTNLLLKWTGIASVIGLISGAGGFFGIDRLAQSAALARKSASGSGVSIGEQNAFRINQNRFLNNPDAMLSRINEINNSFERYKLARIVGHSTDGMSNIQIAEEANLKARQAYIDSHGNFDVLRAKGYGEVYSNDELQRLGNRSEADIRGANDQTNKDISGLNINNPVADKWQEFLNTLDRAGGKINKVLVEGLVAIEGPLGRAVSNFGHLVEVFLKTPAFEHFVNFVADGFGNLADVIGNPEFEKSIKAFAQGIEDAVKAIASFVKKVWDWFGNDKLEDGTTPKVDANGGRTSWFERVTGLGLAKNQGTDPDADGYNPALDPRSRSFNPNAPTITNFQANSGATPSGPEARAAAILAKDGYTPNQIAGFLANIKHESNFNPSEYGDGGQGSSNEAYGLGQWHPDRQADFKNAYGHDIHNSSFDEQVEFMNYELHHKEADAMARLKNAATAYDAGATISEFYERPYAKAKEARDRGMTAQTYGRSDVVVNISNNTGGSAIATVNGLTHTSLAQ